MAPLDGNSEIVERGSEPLEQQRTPGDIGPQQRHTALPGTALQNGDLVARSVVAAREQQLEHRRRAVFEDHPGDVGLGGVAERGT